MIKIKNNEVVEVGLPRDFYEDIGNHRLALKYTMEELREMGWRGLRHNRPQYDPETEYLEFDYYDIQETKVIAHYQVREIPEEEFIEEEEQEYLN